MNRPFYASASNSSTIRQSPSQPPPSVKASVHDRHTHSRNTSDPQDYHRRPPPPPALPRHDDEDTQDTDEDEESGMTAYGTSRSGAPSSLPAGSAGSRPGSSHKDSGAAVKKPKTKSTKVFQCTGYGDCTMQFTRSEHLARHIRKHTGERPFHCDCGRNFSRLDNLRQHMTTVHAQQYPPPSSNAPPARQPPQTKPSGGLHLPAAPPRTSFKNKHRPGPLTLPPQGYSARSPPGSPRYKAYSATAAQFPVTYHDPPPSPLATASGNFSGTNPSWHRPQSALPAIGPLSGGSTSSSGGSGYFSGHLSPPATGTFPPSPSTTYFSQPHSATFIPYSNLQPAIPHHPSYDDRVSRRQSWHEGLNGNKLPSIRTIWTQEDDENHRPPFSLNNFNTSYLRSPVSSKDDHRGQGGFSQPNSRRSSLPSQSRPPIERNNSFERGADEDEDYPMRNGHVPGTPSSVDEDAMEVDSKKITSIADLCHPDRGRKSIDRNRTTGSTGMDLLSQAAAALIDH